ncbi:hypothetical protein ACFYU5_19080 [Nocardia aobensis]|uniref:Uncharacterized protein n=1 Tax=Nocardia aobensis TaxID=257277 RepID=A0ABW6P5U0_9NOCA
MRFLQDLVKYSDQLGLDREIDLKWLTALPYTKLVAFAMEVQQVLVLT